MPNPNDSTDGLVGGISGLDFSHRKMARERTLLSSINDIKITKVIPLDTEKEPVKVFLKNPATKNVKPQKDIASTGTKKGGATPEATPSKNRDANEFMGLGGKGDQDLFDMQEDSHYSKKEIAKKDVGKKKK